MDLSTTVLGSTVAAQIRARQTTPILRIGRDAFTRAQLATVECFNFTAAQNLSTILNRDLNVTSVADVFNTVSPFALALPRLGAVSLAVLGAAFEAKGVGGDAPLEHWMRRHLQKGDALVTFGSIKTKAEKRTTRKQGRRKARPTRTGVN